MVIHCTKCSAGYEENSKTFDSILGEDIHDLWVQTQCPFCGCYNQEPTSLSGIYESLRKIEKTIEELVKWKKKQTVEKEEGDRRA